MRWFAVAPVLRNGMEKITLPWFATLRRGWSGGGRGDS